jgi:undecaprenyl-diphosphatase
MNRGHDFTNSSAFIKNDEHIRYKNISMAIGNIIASYVFWIIPALTLLVGRKAVYHGAWTAVLGTIVKELIRAFFPISRPPAAAELGFLSPGFPSGHATVSFGIATVIYMYNKKYGIIAYALAIAVCIARIVLGIHYWWDILGGIVLGSAVGYWIVKKY